MDRLGGGMAGKGGKGVWRVRTSVKYVWSMGIHYDGWRDAHLSNPEKAQ
jgi:hypothetical protein